MVSLTERAQSLYRGEALAPMVRASTIPLRTLALQYGADFVYTEELVDRALSNTTRVVNETLGTIDYVKDASTLSAKVQRRLAREGDRPPLILRIDRRVEGGKLICQLGTGEPELALAAARHVARDVDALDINMGCPKKFSVSGGMGSALLSDPERASRIIKTLRDELPDTLVSCKIRLLRDTENTVDFITAMVNSGAHAVAIHARRVGDESVKPADWESLKEVLALVRSKYPTLPLLVNGDFYTRQEFTDFMKHHEANGVLLARPALYNTSIFRKPKATTSGNISQDASNSSSSLGYDSPWLLDKTKVIQEYVQHAARYDTHYKNAKYVICEMMNNRRAPTCRSLFLPHIYPEGQTMGKTCDCKSLEQVCQLWNVNYSQYYQSHAATATCSSLRAGEHRYEDSYFLGSYEETAAAKSTDTGHLDEELQNKTSDRRVGEDHPAPKRVKTGSS